MPKLMRHVTTDAVEFQKSDSAFLSSLSAGTLLGALNDFQRILLHEFEKGKAVHLPFIGTFTPSLKGEIRETEDGYLGRNVHVDGILFQPDRELLDATKKIKVDQKPYIQAIHTDRHDVDQRLTELFATHETITHRDVRYAFEQTLTPHRISDLLSRLVREGRLIRIGCGCQTHYRPAPGQFGRYEVNEQNDLTI
ncbi:MAG: hypothetical protein J6E29_01120 [Prevotella sp.]|nr:hypothetical protein [Prevotella sp.]